LAAKPKKPAASARILLDLGLPGQDGLALCVHIRKNSRTPIGFVASRDSTNDELRAWSLGERRKAI
jgi:DNA-binding response OmpR family regulator